MVNAREFCSGKYTRCSLIGARSAASDRKTIGSRGSYSESLALILTTCLRGMNSTSIYVKAHSEYRTIRVSARLSIPNSKL